MEKKRLKIDKLAEIFIASGGIIKSSMTKKDVIKYWLETAEEDLETAKLLFKSNKFNYALFFKHLAIEKLLKGLVCKNRNVPPTYTHDLKDLTKQAKIKITKKMETDLKEITSWNISARHDSYKRIFYKKANYKFTTTWDKKAREICIWLKEQY